MVRQAHTVMLCSAISLSHPLLCVASRAARLSCLPFVSSDAEAVL